MKHYSKWGLIFIILLVSQFHTTSLGQNDPNPNSPTPILLNEIVSEQELAESRDSSNTNLQKSGPESFRLNSKIILFATNLELLKGEGSEAFRIYAKDNKNKTFRFPVLEFRTLNEKKRIYSITVLLKSEFEHLGQPAEDANLQLSLSWRGLISNSIKLNLGKSRGKLSLTKEILERQSKFQSESSNKQVPTSIYVGYRWSGRNRPIRKPFTK